MEIDVNESPKWVFIVRRRFKSLNFNDRTENYTESQQKNCNFYKRSAASAVSNLSAKNIDFLSFLTMKCEHKHPHFKVLEKGDFTNLKTSEMENLGGSG